MTNYYKATKNGEHKFYALFEDNDYNMFAREFAIEDGVNIDTDYSWHNHSYDIDFLDLYTFENAYNLVKSVILELGSKLAYSDYIGERRYMEDVDDLKTWILDNLAYGGISALYDAVNNDKTNNIVAYVLSGNTQGESAYIWFNDEKIKNLYTPDYMSGVLFGWWFNVVAVDEHGEPLQEFDSIVDNINVYENDENDYMLKKWHAKPAKTESSIKIL